MPGLTASRSTRSVRATTSPARRMAWICSGVLISIPDLALMPGLLSTGERPQRGQRALGDLLDRPGRVDTDQDALVGVVGHQRRGLLLVDLEPVPDGLLAVVVALAQLATAGVTDAVPGGRVEHDVPDPLAAPAGAPAGQP